MAEKLNVERPEWGERAEVDAAAESAQVPPIDTAEQVAADLATATEQLGQVGGEAAPAVEAVTPAVQQAQETQRQTASMPTQPRVRGVLGAPASMVQPVRTQFERDQEVAMMWRTVVDARGSAVTQAIYDGLSGAD